MKTLIDKRIIKKNKCTGCYACFNICPHNCISMENDEEGFWYPKVDYGICAYCGSCVHVCPIINRDVVKNIPKAYACINKDDNIRLRSSSGGLFSIIAEKILDDDGIVFGVGLNEKFKVMHNYIENKKEIERFRGSKYVQSKIGNTFRQVQNFLKQGRRVLFTGTPCQVAGLKSFLGKEHKNLICIDNICHGVPSPKVWNEYIIFRKNMVGWPVRKIAFRQKNDGWKRYSISITYMNDMEYRQTHDKDLYMKAFLKNICLRPSCYDCQFKGLNRQSDITLADFWGIQHLLPEMDDDKGTSLIFINSDKGYAMFEKIKTNLFYKEVDINQVIQYNPSSIKSVAFNPKREGFFKELGKLDFNKLVNKYCMDGLLVRFKKRTRTLIKNLMRNNLYA